jgi:UDP-N-acetylglucosamine:LPS N-acetylglucosamine transferase
MKWGVRRASRFSARNEKLARKALGYDKKAAVLRKKSEKAHANRDLETSNRAAIKAAKCRKKAAIIVKKSLKGTDSQKLTAERKAIKMIKDFSPDVVVGTGGYVCWPVLRAAQKLKIPTVIHESNLVPGMVTKLLSKKCTLTLS